MHETAYGNNLKKIQHANEKLIELREKIKKYDAELKMSAAEAEIAKLSETLRHEPDDRLRPDRERHPAEDRPEPRQGARRGRPVRRRASPRSRPRSACRASWPSRRSRDFEVELGLRSPETTPVAQTAKDLGPAAPRRPTEKQTKLRQADPACTGAMNQWRTDSPNPRSTSRSSSSSLGLVGLALWRYGAIGPKAATGQIHGRRAEADEEAAPRRPTPPASRRSRNTTTSPAAKLPEVKGISSYKPMADRTVRFAINVWAGWSPIIYANNGFKPGKVWKTPGGKDFKVELVLIDDPVAMRDAYAAGNLHIGWATLDMLPLFLEGLRKDSRVMPRVYQQVDWSNGGDGIVVRETIKTMADLRGKTIVLAQNSPSHFFVLNALINAGVQPAEVDFKFTQDAFQAAAAFNADKSIAGVVSWAPDIYNLEKVKGNRMLVTTATANKLIADVWFARADFAKDNPDIIEGLVRGIFDAMEDLKAQDAQAEGRQADGGRLLDSRERRARHARRRALDQLRREPRVLPEPEQPDQLRAHLEHRVLPLQEDRRGHRADAVRPGDGLLGHPEARRASRSTRARRTSTTSSSRRRAPARCRARRTRSSPRPS